MLVTLPCLAVEDDILTICWLITTSRNNSSDFIGGSSGKVVAVVVTVLIKTQSNGALMLRWHVPGQLKSCLVQLNSWMMVVEHVMQNLHGVMKKIMVVLIGHAIVESIGWIIDIELAVNGVFARLGKKRASATRECTMNLEDICCNSTKD